MQSRAFQTVVSPARAIDVRERPLSVAEERRFRNDGFLRVPALCNDADLRTIGAQLRRLFERRSGRLEGNQFDMLGLDQEDRDAIQPQILKPSLYAPALLRTAYFRRVQALARQLLGRDATLSFDHSILKPAGKAAATPWHQDEAHRHDPLLQYEQISFWMPLQDVTEVNGCMRYVPGSNRGPLLPHRSILDDPRIHALECQTRYFDESRARSLPVAAGDCILHAGRTLHCATPNMSTADRLVYVIAFRGPATPRRTPMQLSWMVAKRTQGHARHERWRSHGGRVVLFVRWLWQILKLDLGALPQRLANLRYRLLWGARDRRT